MLLHHLVASTSPGAVGSVSQPSALISSALASSSSTLGPTFYSFSRYLSLVS
jgi:hypothetical protein